MNKYLYKVSFGFREKGEIVRNWSSKNIIAENGKQAISRARLGKTYFVEEVRQIAEVNVR